MRKFFAPNRIAVYIAGAGALATAVAPIVADLNVEDTASIVAGMAALLVTVGTFLKGWRGHEARAAKNEQQSSRAVSDLVEDVDELDNRLAQLEKPDNSPLVGPSFVSWSDYAIHADELGRLIDRVEALEQVAFNTSPYSYPR